ncbi:hypothetical protein [Bacillus sp. T2.9-1]|nr:hypothetical protein [Bacillus sp. T2.9-1]
MAEKSSVLADNPQVWLKRAVFWLKNPKFWLKRAVFWLKNPKFG